MFDVQVFIEEPHATKSKPVRTIEFELYL